MADLQSCVVVVPGNRAGRRLLEILVAESSLRKLRFVPPRIVTLGVLPELLCPAQRPLAGSLAQLSAWAQVLRKTDFKQLKGFSFPPDLSGRMEWAKRLARLHEELSAEGYDFATVGKEAEKLKHHSSIENWRVLTEIQQRYNTRLDQCGLDDPFLAPKKSIEAGVCRTDCQLVLVGITDMHRLSKQLLNAVRQHVSALVFAPENIQDRFDEFGCLIPNSWVEHVPCLSNDDIVFVDGPEDQASTVLQCISSWLKRYAVPEISVGVPDAEVHPFLEQILRRGGVPARSSTGPQVAALPVYQFLLAAVGYLKNRQLSGLADLLRHPDFAYWLRVQVRGRPSISHQDWLTFMDDFQSEHLVENLDCDWPESAKNGKVLRILCDETDRFLADLMGHPGPLSTWSEPLSRVLTEMYRGRKFRNHVPEHLLRLQELNLFRELLLEINSLPKGNSQSCSAAEAFEILLGQMDTKQLAPTQGQAAVELLGWLELSLDDAPALIVTGCNEGSVPAGVSPDAFLPEVLRRQLGLVDEMHRFARDAYALQLMLASRQKFKLIAGRQSVDGTPLKPSRLLLVNQGDNLVSRIHLFFGAGSKERVAGTAGLVPGCEISAFEIPEPERQPEPLGVLHVTAFKDYLTCPYRFYLKHVLELKSSRDNSREMDAKQFGTLIHEVLQRFAASRLPRGAAENQLRECVLTHLNEVVVKRFGNRPLATVQIQKELIRKRLENFVRWQLGWAANGWVISHWEREFKDDQSRLLVDNEPFFLRGKIDRIDLNENGNDCVIFDYKTFSEIKKPESTHRNRDGIWTDLQLPLYRHLAAALNLPNSLRLGYIVLPKSPRVREQLAEWDQQDLDEADEAAAQVIRHIRRQIFWPPNPAPQQFFEDYAAICQEGQFISRSGDDEEDVNV